MVSLAAGGSAGGESGRWVIRDLGTLGEPESKAVAINERGQVVGAADTVARYSHAFLWQDGRLRDLGTLGGKRSGANAINERGQVVGWALTPADPNGYEVANAFLWQNGKMRVLGTLGGPESEAVAINERGQVAGSAVMLPSGEHGGFLWEKGRFLTLDTWANIGEVVDLNDRGQVLTERAVWQQGKTRRLGNWRFRRCVASDINERGVVVGACGDVELRSRPVIWKGRKPTEIGIAYGDRGEAAAVNDIGQVVGFTTLVTRGSTVRHTTRHAFVWENGRTTDLGTLGGQESEATAINNHGQIVGWADTKSGDHHAVLWTKRG